MLLYNMNDFEMVVFDVNGARMVVINALFMPWCAKHNPVVKNTTGELIAIANYIATEKYGFKSFEPERNECTSDRAVGKMIDNYGKVASEYVVIKPVEEQ